MTKRSSLVILGIALLAAIAIPAALAGSKGTDRPIKGDLTGLVQFGGEGNHDGLTNVKKCNPEGPAYVQVTTFTSADGQVSHLGKTHVESAHCNSPDGPVDGQMAFVAANGDVLYGEYDGRYTEDDIEGYVTFMPTNTKDACYLLNDVPCESTGRFARASGSVVMHNIAMPADENDVFIPWLFWGEFEGSVSY